MAMYFQDNVPLCKMRAIEDDHLKIVPKAEKNEKQRGSAWNARFIAWNGYCLAWFQRGSTHQKIKVQFRFFWGILVILTVLELHGNVGPWNSMHCSPWHSHALGSMES